MPSLLYNWKFVSPKPPFPLLAGPHLAGNHPFVLYIYESISVLFASVGWLVGCLS